MQGITLLSVGEEFCAPVIEQHHVPLLGTIAFAGLARAGIHGVIASHWLAGTGSGQHWQKQRKIGKARQYFFNADEGYHRFG